MPHPTFAISAEDIRLLDDARSRELVARLCRAEIRTQGGSEGSVTWGGDQRAKDGGVDVRVDADASIGSTSYIPKPATAYQVKAERFAAGKIAPEMAPAGVLRPAIPELAASAGAYIIVSTRDSVSDSSLASRKQAMSDCLRDHGLTGRVAVDFFDGRRVADWVEQHPTVAIWLRSTLGRPLVGWRPYGPWAYREDATDSEYVIDNQARIFLPDSDEPQDVLKAIDSLRGNLKARSSVRLVGLSGVGKTRLVQALFDHRIITPIPSPNEATVIYTDLSDSPSPQPTAMIESLLDSGVSASVVIDNCGVDLHKRLTDLVKRSDSRLSMVTVEYDIRDDLPDGTLCYRLEAASDEVIKKLLVRRFPDLSGNDVQRVAEFSDGNARVAFALAGASEHRNDLAQLGDDDLFRRLFHQKQNENHELLQCAEAASLLYSFDGEDISSTSELALLASLAEVSIVTFSRSIAELQRRGLVQQRGQWRAVLPHAIANRLAARALSNSPASLLISALIASASDRVARSFSRRIGYLHSVASAQRLVHELLKTGGILSELDQLNELGRQMLRNVAPVDPEATLRLLLQAVDKGLATAAHIGNRSDFVRIARSIAYDDALFDDALSVLLALSQAKPEERHSHSPIEAISTLFYIHYSGTHAALNRRVQQLRRLLRSSNATHSKIGILALKAALQTSHFAPHFEFEFGARPRDYGWWPKTYDEVLVWYHRFIDIAIEYGSVDTELGKEVRHALGEAFRGLWAHAGATARLRDAAQQLGSTVGWPDGWIGARQTLRWNRSKLGEDDLQRLLEVERMLEPRDLTSAIRTRVLSRGSFTVDLEGDADDKNDPMRPYERAQADAEDLGRLAGAAPEVVLVLMPEILSTQSTEKLYRFGVGLGSTSGNLEATIDAARSAISAKGSEPTSLQAIRGLLNSWDKRDHAAASEFLDTAVTDVVWGKRFPELQCAVGLEPGGYERVVASLANGAAPIWQYTYLGHGRISDSLGVPQVLNIATTIADREGGSSVAIDYLGMVVHSASEHGDDYVFALASALGDFLASIDYAKLDVSDQMVEYHLDVLTTFYLKHSSDQSRDTRVLKRMLKWETSNGRAYAYRRGRFLKVFFALRPRMALEAIYKPDRDGKYTLATSLAANHDSDRSERSMAVVPVDDLIEWCLESPADRCLFAAHTCSLYAPDSPAVEQGNQTQHISDVARRILSVAPDKEAVVSAYVERLIPMSSSSGSLSAKLLRRLSVLDEIPTEGDAGLSEYVAEQKQRLVQVARTMELREQERERRSGSFE